MATIFRVGEKPQTIKPKNGRKFGLEEMQKLVGGWVELLYIDHNTIMLFDGEARLKNSPHNLTASFHAARDLYGTVVKCNEREF